MKKRVVVVDDRPIVRRGLVPVIGESSDLEPITAVSHEELLSAVRSDAVEAVVMSVGFGRNAIDVLRSLKKAFPELPVLMFSTHADDVVPLHLLKAGASGYVQKDSSPEELLVAIRRLIAGGTFLSNGVAEQIASDLSRGEGDRRLQDRLSKRELEVFRYLGLGKSVGQIAAKLKISVKTVSTHRARILDKTGLKNNAGIIRYWITHHL